MFEIDDAAPKLSPADAAPVEDVLTDVDVEQAAMTRLMARYARPTSWLGRLFWAALTGLIGIGLSLWVWQTFTALLAQYPLLGQIALGFLGIVLSVLILVALKEMLSLLRLRRLGHLQARAGQVETLTEARALSNAVLKLYRTQSELSWAVTRVREAEADVFDADAQLALLETHLIGEIDQSATRVVERSARQVAAVTALVPIMLADVIVALSTNLRMIRQIAELYGGRGGMIGSWRLVRRVMTHLIATGALAMGDDLMGSVVGGSLLGKLSRRFGEGVINGALTARVGVVAIELCRPIPFNAVQKPKVGTVLKNAMSGVFTRETG